MVIQCSNLNFLRRSVSLGFALCVFQFFLSASIAVFSALAFAPVMAHKYMFDGRCALFAGGTWNLTTGELDMRWPSVEYCDFAMASALMCLIVSLYNAIRYCKIVLGRRRFEQGIFEDVALFPAFLDVVAGATMTAFSVASAVVVTAGTNAWCAVLAPKFERCSDANAQHILRDISTVNFSLDLSIAEAGSIGSALASAGFLALSLLKFCRYYDAWSISHSSALHRDKLLADFYRRRRMNEGATYGSDGTAAVAIAGAAGGRGGGALAALSDSEDEEESVRRVRQQSQSVRTAEVQVHRPDANTGAIPKVRNLPVV